MSRIFCIFWLLVWFTAGRHEIGDLWVLVLFTVLMRYNYICRMHDVISLLLDPKLVHLAHRT